MDLLVRHRRELRLNSAQVAQLREIQTKLERTNRPLVDRLLEIQELVQAERAERERDGADGMRLPLPIHLEIARAPMQRLQSNNREAMHAVGRVLTRRQKRRASALLELGDPQSRWFGSGRRSGGR